MTHGPDGRRRQLVTVLPWLVVGVVMVALAGVAVVRLAVGADEPTEADSVRDVADMAQVIAEELDVDSGLDLLCDEPIELYKMAVESTIIRWQTMSGSPAPTVTARVSEVDDGPTGSFLLRVSPDDRALKDEQRTFRVFVESRDGRSCVAGIGGRKADRASIRFADDGYSGVVSPTPTPGPPRSPTPTRGTSP
ncbi:hypothetical protein [Nocardioides plantarum]|uniref:Uncharacterized protein n=1 Tax=Nocardioides plantarum TaxID=29299 RepID=A0ABV5KEP3_9ACTN|nr:hypothetical protein [Nocardioides plantarum]